AACPRSIRSAALPRLVGGKSSYTVGRGRNVLDSCNKPAIPTRMYLLVGHEVFLCESSRADILVQLGEKLDNFGMLCGGRRIGERFDPVALAQTIGNRRPAF